MGIEKRRTIAAYCFIGPWVLGFLGFTLYPLVISFYASLCNWTYAEKTWVGFSNYLKVLADINFWRSGFNTVVFGVISTPITLSFALLLALLINQKLKGINFFRALYFLPVVAASDVISTLAGNILFSRVLVINIDLSRFGIYLSGNTQFYLTVAAILLTLSLWRTGIQMLIFLMGLSNVPLEYYEAAEIDGATLWQKFWWVTIPSISPMILLNILLTIIESFTSLATTMQLIGRGYIQLFIWDYIGNLSSRMGDYGMGLAVDWIFIFTVLGLIGLIYRLVNRKVSY